MEDTESMVSLKLTILKPSEFSRLKATVQKSGKLGFTKNSANMLALDENVFAVIAKDSVENLYIRFTNEESEETFPIRKSGDYLYINTTDLFLKMGIDFKKKALVFYLSEKNMKGVTWFKMIKN